MLKQFDFEVAAPGKGNGSFTATVRIGMTDDMKPAEVLQYLQSPQLKDDFRRGWVETECPGYGFAVRNDDVERNAEAVLPVPRTLRRVLDEGGQVGRWTFGLRGGIQL